MKIALLYKTGDMLSNQSIRTFYSTDWNDI